MGTASSSPDRVLRSSSGQFTLQGPGSTLRASLTNTALDRSRLVQLDVAQLAVTSERVKSALLRELGLPDRWTGRVRVAIQNFAPPEQNITIESNRQTDGWHYVVGIPERIQPEKLVRGLVQVLVMELANRPAQWQPAVPPLWLNEGLAARVWQLYGFGLMAQPESFTSQTIQQGDPMQHTRLCLSTNEPLTFSQLSLPEPTLLAPAGFSLYQHHANLLVHEILRLRLGRERLVAFIQQLPQVLNWQTAFLQVYRPEFASLLAVEKWWSLILVNFTGRDPSRLWGSDLSYSRLSTALHVITMMHAGPQELPRRTAVPLQQALANWDPRTRSALVRERINHIRTIQPNLPKPWFILAERYRAALEQYLTAYQPTRRQIGLRRSLEMQQRVASDALVRQLNELDALRENLRQNTEPTSPSAPVAARDTTLPP